MAMVDDTPRGRWALRSRFEVGTRLRIKSLPSLFCPEDFSTSVRVAMTTSWYITRYWRTGTPSFAPLCPEVLWRVEWPVRGALCFFTLSHLKQQVEHRCSNHRPFRPLLPRVSQLFPWESISATITPRIQVDLNQSKYSMGKRRRRRIW